MSVYVDGLRWWGFKVRGREAKTCHLTADTLHELYDFADRIGIPAGWIHAKPRPHYDLTKKYRDAALRHGAVVMKRNARPGSKPEAR